MSQYKHIRHKAMAGLACLSVSSLALMSAHTAFAATHTPVKVKSAKTVIHKAEFENTNRIPTRTLDWRNPVAQTEFVIPETFWVDGAELVLSADAIGQVDNRTPLMVRFNNAQPIPVHAKGKTFDARITLNTEYLRPRDNTLTFYYNTPAGQTCLTEDNGAWSMDLKNSFVVLKARPKTRSLYIREVEDLLALPQVAPKSIALLTHHSQDLGLHALAAQAVALRMDDIPNFQTTTRGADMQVVMATRDNFGAWVTDPYILRDSGPKIYVHDGQPLKLVITGDTEAEVMAMARGFAERRLPQSRRKGASLGEVRLQDPLSSDHLTVTQRTELDDLGPTFFETNWAPQPRIIDFNISDPSASETTLSLEMSAGMTVGSGSRVAVHMNDEPLGFVDLKSGKSAANFKVPPHILHGQNNHLKLTPDLRPSDSANRCGFASTPHGLQLLSGSFIDVKTTAPSPVTELSQFTASGSLFAANNGQNTQVFLTGTSAADHNAGLKLVGKLAKSSGRAWTGAQFNRAPDTPLLSVSKNTLVIGPRVEALDPLLQTAPRSFDAGLKGQAVTGDAIIRHAEIARYASADGTAAFKAYALAQGTTERISTGGLAALYVTDAPDTHLVGVITNTAGSAFAPMGESLLNNDHWQALSGSVARWNASTVISAQLAAATALDQRPEMTAKPSFGIGDFTLPLPTLPEIDLEPAAEFWDKTTHAVTDFITQVGTLIDNIGTQKEATYTPPPKPHYPTAGDPQPTPVQLRPASMPTQTVELPLAKVVEVSTPVAAPITVPAPKPAPVSATASASVPEHVIDMIPELTTDDLPQSTSSTVNPASYPHPTYVTAEAPKTAFNWKSINFQKSAQTLQAKIEPLRHNLVKAAGVHPDQKTMSETRRIFSPTGLLLILTVIIMMLMIAIAAPNGRRTR